MKSRFAAALAAACFAAPVLAADLELDSDEVPVCGQPQYNAWRKAVAQSFGVAAASDPGGHAIGTARVEKQVRGRFFPAYTPYSPFKETLCGIVGRSRLDGVDGGAAGWNVYLIPDDDFAHLLSLPRAGGAGDLNDCGCGTLIEGCGAGVDNCMEAEVTPARGFLDNPWFPAHGSSTLAGRKICAYGPWVADYGHGRRPEIHPAEIFWWRGDGGDASELFRVVQIQDDSDRFDRPRRGGWRYSPESAEGTEPWSRAPRKHRLRFAFEWAPGSPTYKFDVYQHPDGRRHVVTADHPELVADADDGRHHALAIDGEVAVEAEEMGDVDDVLGVTFAEVCKSFDGSRFQGWVQIRSALGADDDGKEGFLALAVVKHEAGAASRKPDFPTSPEPRRGAQETEVRARRGPPSADLAADGAYRLPGRPRVWRTMARMIRITAEQPPSEVVGAKSVLVTLVSEPAPTGGAAAAGSPVTVTWTYEARNLTSGRFVPLVHDRSANPEAVAVERTGAGSGAGDGVRFTFPVDRRRDLIEILATATVTDASGNRTTVEKKVWNHALRASREQADLWLKTLAEMREVSVRLLSESALDADRDSIGGSLEARRAAARLARLRFLEAAADGRVDLDELRDLLGLVEAYGGLMLPQRRF